MTTALIRLKDEMGNQSMTDPRKAGVPMCRVYLRKNWKREISPRRGLLVWQSLPRLSAEFVRTYSSALTAFPYSLSPSWSKLSSPYPKPPWPTNSNAVRLSQSKTSTVVCLFPTSFSKAPRSYRWVDILTHFRYKYLLISPCELLHRISA